MLKKIREMYEENKEWYKRHPKITKTLKIFILCAITVNVILRIFLYYYDLRRKINESCFSSEIIKVNMSVDDKVNEFDYIYKVLNINMPSITLFKEKFGIDFNENSEKYRSLISETKDDFDYYCTLKGIFSDIPSAHTDLLYPNYKNYTILYGYNYDKFLATWNLKNYTDYWYNLIDEKCKECYTDKYFIFNYYSGDGKYFFNSSMGIANYTDEYENSCLTSIDGVPVDQYIKQNIMYSDICYDNINDKVYRTQIMFNSVSEYGRKVTVSICLADGSSVERELYMSCADDLIIYHGCIFDERYAKNATEAEELVDNGVPYYFYEDTENNLTYAWISSVDYGFGKKIRDEISSVKTDNIILDLRDNGGGTAYYFYEYLYTPLFNNDFKYENNFFIAETMLNNNNIYKINLVYDIYRAINFPRKYYTGQPLDGIPSDCKVVVESNNFKCIGGKNSDKRVYLLIGKNTASAADGFAAIIKQGTDTVLVGENTAGEGMGGSYVLIALPESKLAFTYNPALAFNPDGTNNSVYGTSPNFYVPDCTLENFVLRNKMISDYGTAYAYAYEHRVLWDNQLEFTVNMIKEDESDKGNNSLNK